MTHRSEQDGFALVATLMLAAIMAAMLIGYFALTHMETGATRSSMDSTTGYYAAEGGLNIRSEQIRQSFLGYLRPAGTSPDPTAGGLCLGSNVGSADFRCLEHALENRTVTTYVEETPGNPGSIVVPRGEPFQNLQAQVYGYTVASVSYGFSGHAEAVLEMDLESRLIPMFQFAAFYNKDLEILPGPAMTLSGPVHVNGDLYLNANTSLDILGQVTTTQNVYRGRKDSDTCNNTPVRVIDAATVPTPLPACSGQREALAQSDLDALGVLVETWVDEVVVPDPGALDAAQGEIYWDNADLRIVLDLDVSPAVIEVRNPDQSVDAVATANLTACGAATYSETLYNFREGDTIKLMNVDLQAVLDCAAASFVLDGAKQLDDATHGGLVFHLAVEGPAMAGVNDYGVRVTNGAEIVSTIGGAPVPLGLTVVTNQALYVEGDFNAVNKKPASFLADSLNVLSNNWNDANSALAMSSRLASDTTINAAFLGGTDSTGDQEGSTGQDLGSYNGGLENYPRFHENWGGRTLSYRGSFVSLNLPVHVDGPWGNSSYSPPIRDWNYDVDFNDASRLPPLSPRFVTLKQNLFVRKFEF